MPKRETELGAVCSQLLTAADLHVGEALAERIDKEKVVVKISIDEERASVRFFSDRQLLLSDITPLLHDFDFVVIDEVTYTVTRSNRQIHVCRFNLLLDDPQAFAAARHNMESVITASLLGDTFSNCRLYVLVHRQNLTLRQVTLLRAMIEYVNQALPSVNFDTILHTVTRYGELAKLLLHYFIARFDPGLTKRTAKIGVFGVGHSVFVDGYLPIATEIDGAFDSLRAGGFLPPGGLGAYAFDRLKVPVNQDIYRGLSSILGAEQWIGFAGYPLRRFPSNERET